MTKEITPMNAGVAAIPWTELSHRKIQDEWFKHIRFDDGKPHLQAMFLLSDVVYCYQPRVVEDPRTGIVLCYERRFEGEMLQRDAEYYERYGFTEKQYRTALDRLCEIGVCFRVTVAKVDFVDGNGATRTRYSVPYIGLDTQILYEITVPVEIRYLLVQRGGGCPTGHPVTIYIQRIIIYLPLTLARVVPIHFLAKQPRISSASAPHKLPLNRTNY